MPARKILIADADRAFVAAASTALMADGHGVTVAARVPEAVEAVRRQPPDLFFIAGDLPGGGLDALHAEIKRLCDSPAPIVAVTDERDRSQAGESSKNQSRSGIAARINRNADQAAILTLAKRLLGEDVTVRSTAGRQRLSVLIVESDEQQRQCMAKALDAPGRETIDVSLADSVSQAVALICEHKYGCVLLSHELSDGFGMDILQSQDEQLMTTPIIAMSENDEPALAVEYFRAGCEEYLVKSEAMARGDLRRIVAEVIAWFHRRVIATIIERRQLQHGIVESQEGLIALARTDPLTGICNRGVFDEFIEQHHRQAVERRGQYGILMIDVDRFKQYNDHYGHAAGDNTLRSVAQALLLGLRDNDFIARYGGEEVVIVLDSIGPANIGRVADRFRRLVFDRNIEHAGNAPHSRVTVSVGAAMLPPGSSMTVDDVLARADQALYAAKAAGRNAIIVAENTAAAAAPEPSSSSSNESATADLQQCASSTASV